MVGLMEQGSMYVEIRELRHYWVRVAALVSFLESSNY